MQISAPCTDDLEPLKRLVESAPMAIALLDCNLRYLLISRQWQIDYGLPTDPIDQSHYELLPDLPQQWKAAYQRSLRGAIESGEGLLTRADGSSEWMKWQARSWQSRPDEPGRLLIFSEVTTKQRRLEASLQQAYDILAINESERIADLTQANAALQAEVAASKQAMSALRDRNCHLQQILDSLPQTIFWKDRNSVYQGCNRSFAQDAGVETPNQIVGKTDYDLMWSKVEGDLFRAFDRRVMDRNQPELHVIEPPSVPNQQQGWVETSKIPLHDDRGNVIGILGTYEDITERAQEADALRQSEARLRQQAQQLEQTLSELQQTQIKLLHSEKMSSLGQLVAGVAHEINNPTSFIQGNLVHAEEYIQNLLNLLHLYRQDYPQPSPRIVAMTEEIELGFLWQDLSKLLASMKMGADRICNIVKSLRSFSRLDEAEVKAVDIHEGIDSTLMILQNRFRATADRPAIKVVKQYGSLPLVQCYAGSLNQVFMNVFANAIDAFDEAPDSTPTITISTEVQTLHSDLPKQILIRIADNGQGMSETTQHRLFDPFFTTKPVGKGTGLGLSISYQIVVDRHGGSLRCNSSLGNGAEFSIEIPAQIRGL